ncbi:hypothetical protein ACIO93_26050 [Streptomyces sp. NPDC087903]|uniref:hypothetical protein n=1 Tax=Streptomyces sp. NPDC087903 TaxID=3365819 RepID=UPI0038244474
MSALFPPTPSPSRPAISHPPTRRAIRRRVARHAVLLFLAWPALLTLLVRAAADDRRFVPVMGWVFITALMLVPLNLWAAVTALRVHRRLSGHAWRPMKCEVVPTAGSHGWRLKAYDASADHETRVLAILRVRDTVLVASPFKRYVSSRLGEVWCAGSAESGAVMCEPGGARPFRVVRYKGSVRLSEPNAARPSTTG